MRILVVEDQDSIRRMIEALVQARGHDVTAVSSGTKAIDVAMTDPPHLVLLDLNLPGQYDGFEVCRRLRSDPGTAKVPVVIISALDDQRITQSRSRGRRDVAYYTQALQPDRSAQGDRSPEEPQPHATSARPRRREQRWQDSKTESE